MTALPPPITLTEMPSLILQRKWHMCESDPSEIAELARRVGVPFLIARLLLQRGVSAPAAVSRHLTPTLQSLSDPLLMLDMDRAVDRLVAAVADREPVVVFGDYDADGVTGATLLGNFLEGLGLSVKVYLPHREREGYGLNAEAVRGLAAEGYRLVVTVDCGIADVAEVGLANQLGMDVIITDHHEPPPEIPPAVAVLDPKRRECRFPFKELAGVGVAFNLVRALRQRLHTAGHWQGGQVPNLKAYLDLVALGTIADVVPLIEDNRVLVRVGLEVLDRTERPGIRALRSAAGLAPPITAQDVAFRLAPSINAAGRMAHPESAWRLLSTQDEAEGARLAQTLLGLNRERQLEEARILKEAMAQVEVLGTQAAYVLASASWRRGVVGIVASRLVDALSRPAILLALDGEDAYGSGRSPEGLDLYRAVASCGHHLIAFGGHKVAAGLRLCAKDLKAFARAFEDAVAAATSGRDLTPHVRVDGPASVPELLDPAFERCYGLLEPFGAGYPEPLFAISGSSVCRRRVVGDRHLKLNLAADHRGLPALDVMAWGLGNRIDTPWETLDLACRPRVNTWNGQQRMELRLVDARPQTDRDSPAGTGGAPW